MLAARMSPVRSIVVTTLTNCCGVVLALGTSAILARTLGPAGRGEYAAILNWVSASAAFGQLGLGYAIPCHVASSSTRTRAIATSGVLIAAVATTIVTAVVWGCLPWLLRAQSQQTVDTARQVLPALALAIAVYAALLAVLQGLGRFSTWNVMRLSQGVGWLVILICCAALGLRTASAYTRASTASYLVLLPIAAVLIARSTKFAPWTDRRSFRDLLRYALPSWVASLPLFLTRRLDQLALAAFAAPHVLGLYAVAASVTSLLGTFVAAVANVALPHLAGVAAQEERRRLAAKYVRTTVLITVLAGALLFFGLPVLIAIFFGRRFYPAIPVASILTVAAVADGVGRVAEDALIGFGSPRALLKAELLGGGVVAGCLALTLRVSPLYGAAFSAAAGYAVAALVAVWECRALVGGNWSDYLAPRRADLAALVSTAQHTLSRVFA
jgi:O-antigen/teichoic acid export membrane protein